MITSEQIRAARSLLKMEQRVLAKQADVPLPTLKRIEGATGVPATSAQTLLKIQKALEKAGIEFIPEGIYQGEGGPGVRLISD